MFHFPLEITTARLSLILSQAFGVFAWTVISMSHTHCPGRYAGLVCFHESLCQYFLISYRSHAVILKPPRGEVTLGNADFGHFWGCRTIGVVAEPALHASTPGCLDDHYP